MRLRRLFPVGVLVLGCLSGSASAQYYNPYNPYAYPAPTPYYNPYAYQAPSYPYPQSAYYPQAPAYYPRPTAYTAAYSPPPAATLPAPAITLPAPPPAAKPLPRSNDPIVVMPDRSGTMTLPPPSTTAAKKVVKHKTMSQPIVEVTEPGVIPGVGPNGGAAPYGAPCGAACGASCGSACGATCAPACGDACGRPWAPACESCPNDLHRCYFQLGFLIVQPRWNDNAAFVNGSSTSDFVYDWAAAPRAELGFQCCGGFGLRARYQYFYQRANPITFGIGDAASTAAPLGRDILLTPGNFGTAATSLNLQVVDLELQQEFRWGCWSLRGSGGGRVGYMQQHYDFTERDLSNNLISSLTSARHFWGGGPTACIEGRRYFPRCHCALYGIGRGSLLFGTFTQDVVSTLGGVSRSSQDTLPMFDIEGGLEWWCNVGRVRLFCNTGFMAQVWFGAGNASDSSPTFSEANPQSRRDLSLLGLAFSAGIQY